MASWSLSHVAVGFLYEKWSSLDVIRGYYFFLCFTAMTRGGGGGGSWLGLLFSLGFWWGFSLIVYHIFLRFYQFNSLCIFI